MDKEFGKIDNIEFHELASERYWSFPKNYKKDKKVETQEMVFSGEYLGSRKRDGQLFRFIKDMDGNMRLQGRNRGVSGEFTNKIGHVPQLHEFFKLLPNGTCLLGEIYMPSKEISSQVTTIMGCLEEKAIARQEAGEKAVYYIFDIWALRGKSLLSTKFEDRVELLSLMEKRVKKTDVDLSCIEFAHYYTGKKLWGKLQMILASGGEGMVITRRDSAAEPGKRTARKTLKIKKELQDTIDVVILDANPPTRLYNGNEIETWFYWENIRTGEKIGENMFKAYVDGEPVEPVTKSYFNDWAGSLVIGARRGTKLIPVGSLSGLTEEVLSNWKKYKGKVAEITAMEIMQDTKGLRHPKFLNWREDLTPADTDYYRIFNE